MLLNKFLAGVFVADSGYVSKKLADTFYKESIRILITKPLKKMKKLATDAQNELYSSSALIETVFRELKMFDGCHLCRAPWEDTLPITFTRLHRSCSEVWSTEKQARSC
jgi:Transposase DDE domain